MARGISKKSAIKTVSDNIYDRGRAFTVRFSRKGIKVNKDFAYDPSSKAMVDEKDAAGKSTGNQITSRQNAMNHATRYRNAQWEQIVGTGKTIESSTQLALRPLIERYLSEVTLGLKKKKSGHDYTDAEIKASLEDRSIGKKGKATERNRIHRILRDNIFAHVVDHPIAKLSAADFTEVKDELLKTGLEPVSVNRYLSIINQVFEFAILKPDYDIQENPMEHAERAAVRAKAQLRVPTTDELEKTLEYTGSEALDLALRLCIETGARASEIAWLKWDRISLSKQDGNHPHLLFLDTKNGSDRIVPLSPKAVELISRIPVEKRTGFLFPSTKNGSGAIRPHSISTAFRRARQRLNEDGVSVEALRFHGARGRFITETARNVGLLDLATLTGHKDFRVLKERYYAPTPKHLADAMGLTKKTVTVELPEGITAEDIQQLLQKKRKAKATATAREASGKG